MNPIRIVRIQSRICVGGPSLHTAFLSQYLVPRGYETVLVGGQLSPGDASMVPAARARGVNVVLAEHMRRRPGPATDLLALRELIGIIREHRPHIVHTHTAKAGALGRVAAMLCRVPVVVHTFHGHVLHGYFSRPVSAAVKWTERLLGCLTDKIVAISPAQLAELSQTYRVAPPGKFTCIRLGFELDKFRDCAKLKGELRAELGIPADAIVIGHIGRLVPIKNHMMLLHAIDRMKTGRRAVFLIVGDGHLREELEAFAKGAGIADRVIFTGTRLDMDRVYADTDIVVLTSKNEGTPVALIEAMAARKPVVTTDVGGIRDILPEGHGAIVDKDDLDGFSSALQRMIDDDSYRASSVQITDDHLKQFRVERLAQDMDALYKSLLQAKGLI